MRTEITIDGADAAGANYIAWAPVHSSIRLVEADGGAGPVDVLLRNQNPNSEGGQIVFHDVIPGAEQDSLRLRLPADGTPVDFSIAGKFNHPSLEDEDAVIEVVKANTENVLSTKTLMVRIRKNANDLKEGEIERFLIAFTTLNGEGTDRRFLDLRDMHTQEALNEGHSFDGFLPWHRAYLLDLERELQLIDPSVALPYWRFDESAPNLFTPEFIGFTDRESKPPGRVQFASDNPLTYWRTDALQPIIRSPRFNTSESPAGPMPPAVLVRSQDETLNLGEPEYLYANFRAPMELNPHNRAHGSFEPGSVIADPRIAPNDPLFFLLHANVDHLWALWQSGSLLRPSRRFDTRDPATYPRQAPRIGHNLMDSMWPWNGETCGVPANNRPNTAPGGNFPASPTTENAPGDEPRVRDMIDYQGRINPEDRLGFDYDDVPFKFES